MTSSITSNKQNAHPSYIPPRPVHQGRAFRLQLGHSNGPFLPNDIMHSNKKSTYLMAAKQVLQCQMSMSNLMTALSKQQQNQQKIIRNQCKVENWFSKCQFLEGEMKYMDNQSKKLGNQCIKLKKQIKNCFRGLISENQDLCQSFLPLFKNLLKSIRDQNNQQKNIYEQQKRGIEQLFLFRNTYLDQLVGCQTRIIRIEEFSGINQKDQTE